MSAAGVPRADLWLFPDDRATVQVSSINNTQTIIEWSGVRVVMTDDAMREVVAAWQRAKVDGPPVEVRPIQPPEAAG